MLTQRNIVHVYVAILDVVALRADTLTDDEGVSRNLSAQKERPLETYPLAAGAQADPAAPPRDLWQSQKPCVKPWLSPRAHAV